MERLLQQLAQLLVRKLAQKIILWLLGLLGPWGVLVLVIAVIMGGLFGALSSGDYDADGTAGGIADEAFVQPYIEAAAAVNPATPPGEETADNDVYRLNWGLLYAIDTIADRLIEDPEERQQHALAMAEQLAPRYTYRDASITITTTDEAGEESTETIPARLLTRVDTYEGIFTFHYQNRTSTYKAGNLTIQRTEPVLSGQDRTSDYSRLDAELRKQLNRKTITPDDRLFVLQMALGVKQKSENLDWLLGSDGYNPMAGAVYGEIPPELLLYFHQAEDKYGIPWYLLAALAKIESSFNPSATGVECADGQRAQGLMQFKPTTWAAFGQDGDGDGDKNPYNAHDAVFAAANYLIHLKQQLGGDLRLAVKYYGEGTDEYAAKVLSLADAFQHATPNQDGYVWPAQGEISGYFGEVSEYWPNGHGGVDIAAPRGTPVYAVIDGTVQTINRVGGADRNGGNSLILLGRDGNLWYFCHLDGFAVTRGQQVKAGQPIGTVGSTGNTTGPHLHFERWIPPHNSKADPMAVFQH